MADYDIAKSAVRVLIVDDFELWRRHIVDELLKRADYTVVGEASDGPEALQKVEELEPELVLLDVGLPTMDGITVLSAMVRAVPETRILMLSAHNGGAIVHAALRAGARGYLVKSDAGRELMPAIEAVLRGDLYVSRRIESDSALRGEDDQFHPNDETLVSLCDLVVNALEKMQPVIVIATEAHRDKLSTQLQARGIKMNSHERSGYYLAVDAAETLSGFMVDDLPSAPAFFSQMSNLILRAEAASSADREVVVFAEMIELLWARGNQEAAAQLERLWKDLARVSASRLRCAHPSNGFDSESDSSLQAVLSAPNYPALGS